MISRQPLLSRFLNYYTLLAACIVIPFVNFWTFHDTGFQIMRNVPAASPVPAPATTTTQAVEEYKGIPRKLWYKLGPHGMSDEIRDWTKTCIENNPGYQVEFMTDESGDELVKKVFAARPEIVEDYLALQIPIFKADILRYVLLYDQGGVWSDLDISCEGVPIDDWVPEQYRETADLVVGWEFDWGWPGKYIRQFTSWTIMAKKGSPHMMQVIDDIFETLHEKLEENNVSVQDATLKMVGDVVDFSGPRRLTRSVYKSLSTQLNGTIGEDDLSHILQPKLVGNVLVMPGRSFAASANTYTSEEEAQLPPKLVHHHYAGTWKNDHGGEE
jgi:alpha 1,6-mannosyltransferase